MRKLFIISFSILVVSIGILSARDRCGKDFQGIILPKLVGIYRESYVGAGFRVVSQDIKVSDATLRVTFSKEGSMYQRDLEYKFIMVSSGSINACGTEYGVKEPSVYVASERNTYLDFFSKADKKALKKIEKAVVGGK